MAESTNRLFPEFPEVTTQQWEEKIIADLKGKDYEKALVWRTNEGISVRPYYRAENLTGLDYLTHEPGRFPFVRGNKTTNSWLIRQDIVVGDLAAANQKALELLGKGVNSLGFIFKNCVQLSLDDMRILLRGICLEAAEVNFVCPCSDCDLTGVFTQYIIEGPWDRNNVTASISYDPLGSLVVSGRHAEGGLEETMTRLAGQLENLSGLPKVRVIGVNGKIYGNSGASAVQELAFSLAQGAEYLTRLTEMGVKPDTVAGRIKFNLSISGNYFMEIAKLRAGRLLWAQIVKTFGTESDCSARMIVHAETASFNKTVYDAHTNLLRTQTEAMSAALGGAWSVTVLPFDAMFRTPSEFSERIARNQQILLKEESNIDKVTDPAGGAYFIENLTASVAEEAWKLFLEVQEKGGYTVAALDDFIRTSVHEMARRRDLNIALRKENLLGVNQFPNFSEVLQSELDASVFARPGSDNDSEEKVILKPYRGAAAFEAMRYKTDQYAVKNGRPLVFMLTIGNLAMRKARAQFACNFFAVAGFDVMDNNGFNNVEEGLEAARTAKASIVVICSSDEEYAQVVPELAHKAGKEVIVVAGNPACRAELENAGVKNFIHVRSNLLEELTKYQDLVIR